MTSDSFLPGLLFPWSPPPGHLMVVLQFPPLNQSSSLVDSSCLISLLLFALKADDPSAAPPCSDLPHIFTLRVSSHFRRFFHEQDMAGFKILNQIWKNLP